MDVKTRRRQGLINQVQCPKCDSWLRLNPKTEAIKMVGLTALLVTSLLNIFLVFPKYEHELSIVGIVGVSLALFAFLKGKRSVV